MNIRVLIATLTMAHLEDGHYRGRFPEESRRRVGIENLA